MTPTAEDLRWFDSWGGSHYDPENDQLVIVGNPPPYLYAHEEAHHRQRHERTALYRLWEMTKAWPIVGRLARLALELDADLRARTELRAADLWNDENQRASNLVLRSYLCPATLHQ